MRNLLIGEGYEQPYGSTDSEIRQSLGLRGKCADFVGYNPQKGSWLIAESKGSDLWSAEIQIANTLLALLTREPGASGNLELRIYTNRQQYNRLSQDPSGISGYYRQGDFLGLKPDGKTFYFSEILGYRVHIIREGER